MGRGAANATAARMAAGKRLEKRMVKWWCLEFEVWLCVEGVRVVDWRENVVRMESQGV